LHCLDTLKKIKIKKPHKLNKTQVIEKYDLNERQVDLISKYLFKLKQTNEKHNLVGASTIESSWDRHINDSLQLSNFIPKKNSSIIDLGTGAGLPGLILSIYGYKDILLIDSKMKKINFINEFAKENNIKVKTICSRVEKIRNQKFDLIVCRAFAPLVKILNYSLIFSKKNTSLLFLKGRNVKKEIDDAKKIFSFKSDIFPSRSNGDGFVLKIGKFKKL
tara:strand:- start:1793 stop:2449 length:657 start_codon:yes stop_codon:yes gene_type:complete